MSQMAVPQTSPPPTTSPPPEYLRIHLTAPHIPPDCLPTVTTPIYCGELSGAITGGVHSFGYLQLGSQLVYLNMGGPRMAVEAIRARLSRGETIFLNPDDAPSVELSINSKGAFEDYSENMSSHHFQHTILLHRNMFPNYSEPAELTFAFILAKSPEQVYSSFHQHLNQLINLPVFPHWLPTLWATGMSAQIIEKCSGVGAVGYGVFLKASDWEHIISLGVSTGALPLSEKADASQTVTILNIEAQATQPSADEPASASAEPTEADDPVYRFLQDYFGYPAGDIRLTIYMRDVYPILRKHAWSDMPHRQAEMRIALTDVLTKRLSEKYTADEIAHLTTSLMTLGKSLNLSPDIPYPPTIDTLGKRALYRLLGEKETLVLLLDEDIHRLKQHEWRENIFKERNIRAIIMRHVEDESLVRQAFWVIKTHEEY